MASSPQSIDIMSESQVEAFQRDGCVLLQNVFTPEDLHLISDGIEQNLESPSQYASENSVMKAKGVSLMTIAIGNV